jgi:pyruvate dehydrogenase E2 component (dihydrolipoamide acetyltransferase)
MEEGTINRWHKKEGDTIAQGEVVCEVETDKATMDYECAVDGTLLKIAAAPGARVTVGELIAVVGRPGEDFSALLAAGPAPARTAAPAAAATPSPAAQTAEPVVAGVVPASPLARRIAKERGIDLTSVSGSGPGGRVVRSDLDRIATVPAVPAVRSTPPALTRTGDQTIKVSEKRRVIAQRLSQSFFTAPHYFLRNPVRVDALLEARRRVNEDGNQKLSLNAFVVKLTAEALVRHPAVNSSWHGDTIVQHGSVDIALAVAQRDGLITPVVRDCHAKGIAQIDSELKDLIERAKSGTLLPAEYIGSTFTISNLGTFGVREFTAIINPPEAAILGVGEVFKQVTVTPANQMEIQQTMVLTLSCDHRLLDGAVSAAFFAELKRLFEDPMRALL